MTLIRLDHRHAIPALVAAAMIAVPIRSRAQTGPTTGEGVISAMHQRYADTWYGTVSFTEQIRRRTPADTMVTETWREALLIPGRLRIDVEGANPKRSIICNQDSEFVVSGDSIVRLGERNLLLLLGFDVYRQPVETTVSVLRAQHFAMAPMRTDMWEGREVYVIGAPKGDLHTRQIWIDRDRLLFVRLLKPNARDSTKTDEYRFDDYKLEPHGWISETVIAMSGGKLAFKEVYSNVHINAQLNPAMFVPPT